jgi:hypothetical protein
MTGALAAVERGLESAEWACACAFRIGSWTVNLYATREDLRQLLAGLFRQSSVQFGAVHERRSVPAVHLLDHGFDSSVEDFVARESSDSGPVPPDGFVTTRDPGRGLFILRTAAIQAVLIDDARPPRIYLVLDTQQLSQVELRVHLSVVLNSILFELGRLLLHAGSVSLEGRATLLLGDRGAGKSTVCLRLAAAGAVVLSDDHTLLSRDGDVYRVSGCDGDARVTEKTETFMLPAALDVAAQDYAGLLKKQFPVAQFFQSDPHRDYPVDRVLFLSASDRFEVREFSRHEAVPAFISTLRTALRFNGARDFRSYLDYVSDFMRQANVWHVQLSPDLRALDRLVSLLCR